MEGNKTTTTAGSGGISFAGLLAIVFIVLKLCGVISWSWLWVLSPIWISFGLALILFAIVGTLLLIEIIADKNDK